MNNNTSVGRILRLLCLGFSIYIAIRYFWPVLLVIAAVIAWHYFRIRKEIKRAQEEMNRTVYYEAPRQVREERLDEGDIIDAEFTVKNRESESMHG